MAIPILQVRFVDGVDFRLVQIGESEVAIPLGPFAADMFGLLAQLVNHFRSIQDQKAVEENRPIVGEQLIGTDTPVLGIVTPDLTTKIRSLITWLRTRDVEKDLFLSILATRLRVKDVAVFATKIAAYLRGIVPETLHPDPTGRPTLQQVKASLPQDVVSPPAPKPRRSVFTPKVIVGVAAVSAAGYWLTRRR